MIRRTALKLLALGAVLVLAPKQVLAEQLTKKGFCANDESPAFVNPLGADVIRITWGAWLANLSHNYGATKYLIDLSNIDSAFPLNVANLQAVMRHPSYDGWFLLGNEPDLSMSPQAFVNSVLPQIDLVQSADARAKMALAAGTHANPWYKPNSWFEQAWNLIPRGNYKSSIKAFHVHCYSPMNLVKFLSKSNSYRNRNFPQKDLILSETGSSLRSGHGTYEPSNINAMCNLHRFTSWYWYAEYPFTKTNAEHYRCLYDISGNFTNGGRTFASL